ncbi:hypothetical protein SAMN05216387_11243 [Nitrosovibrio tenuis]|uniref:Uncharacterized protein n=1 Tax=Nitrosovibrio tenuis TaxID=1233 RepID=A0A1H7QJ32_9PROT|nr:hypothetical protein SAMN05216387_11243 [Nitrosovibrio tenuis]
MLFIIWLWLFVPALQCLLGRNPAHPGLSQIIGDSATDVNFLAGIIEQRIKCYAVLVQEEVPALRGHFGW